MSEWISVDVASPGKFNTERTQTVLLWCVGQSKSPYTLGYGLMVDGVNYPFKIKRWVSTDSACNVIYGEVTHWMPLPDAPKAN